MPVLNEPIYNGVPLSKLVDKPIYSTGNVVGVDGMNKTKYTFKKGDFIGTLYSWSTLAGNTYMMFYKSQSDYNSFNPFYVKLTSQTTSPSLSQIKEDIKKANEAAANAGKTTLQIYVEKYAPWVVGALVVSIALPSVLNSVRSKSIGAMSKNKGLVIAGGAALLLLAFRKKKSKNFVTLSPVIDVTDWNKTEPLPPVVIQQPRNPPTRIVEPVVKYDDYYTQTVEPVKNTGNGIMMCNSGITDSVNDGYSRFKNMAISGISEKKSMPYTC